MVLCAISVKGFHLKTIKNGTINSMKYCEIVGEFIPYANALFPDGWILEEDGPILHTSREAKVFYGGKLGLNFTGGLQTPWTSTQW